MQRNDRTKNTLLIILMIALITLSIAYATLTQYLYINSQTIISGQNTGWDVRFTSVTCRTTGNASITHDFTMNATLLSGLITRFIAPGDSVICNIGVTNNGTINAKLSSFEIQDGQMTFVGTGNTATTDENLVRNAITYDIVYDQGDANAGLTPAPNDTLPAGVTRNLVLTITYPLSADLPTNNVTVSGLKTTFLYSQN